MYKNCRSFDKFNLENGNNSNAGGSNLHEIFGNEHDDDEIMVNEFNQQP